ncbi:hypothetical protein [Rathayibacter sp. VKM Ac-2835]|uniref:hypothetical protein n=1 Tax=Rathayibacter sp. VKM Ac-2835 TaxID=2739043 RepID=UPI001C25B8B7|nr:hypothetical protein [Rathayibacter sp. VKM Ac-2835]
MTPTSKTTQGTSAVTRRAALATAVRRVAADPIDRKMHVAALSIPATLVVAGWKVTVLFAAPSAFLIVSILFALGTAGAKAMSFRSHRSTSRAVHPTLESRVLALTSYRRVGWMIVVLSALFVVSCLPLLLGGERSKPFDTATALIVATITFVELVMAVCGVVAARRDRALHVEAVRLTSLAGALILLVLTQTALLSIAYDGDPSFYNGLSGAVLGSAAFFVGFGMLVRARRLGRATVLHPFAAVEARP